MGEMKMKQIRLIVIAVICIIMPFMAYYSQERDNRLEKEGIVVEAKIVNEYKMGVSRTAGKRYTVVYTNNNGDEITAEAILNTRGAEVGDVVTVRYLTDNPDKVYGVDSKGLGDISFIVSIGLFFVGILIIFVMIKNRIQKQRII